MTTKELISEFLEVVKRGNFTIDDLVTSGCIGEKEIERTLITHKFKSMRKHSSYEVAVYNCSVYFGVSEGKIRNVIREHSIEL